MNEPKQSHSAEPKNFEAFWRVLRREYRHYNFMSRNYDNGKTVKDIARQTYRLGRKHGEAQLKSSQQQVLFDKDAAEKLSLCSAEVEVLRQQLESTKKAQECSWEEDGGMWATRCGGFWEFSDDAGPEENGMKFCPFCGGKLTSNGKVAE